MQVAVDEAMAVVDVISTANPRIQAALQDLCVLPHVRLQAAQACWLVGWLVGWLGVWVSG
jgi:hypothetical protein